MKKMVLFLSLFFTSIIVANAELCVHITGDGTKIGDEIACGTEHFYVISNDGENIRMMAFHHSAEVIADVVIALAMKYKNRR